MLEQILWIGLIELDGIEYFGLHPFVIDPLVFISWDRYFGSNTLNRIRETAYFGLHA